ncbi:SRPBCC family protein [Streptomyces ficellus]|uniref:SRPBCC family protein n=1 Tax=Streptomyces ficellus TaxID=1977088 RepID=A0A6I6FNQ5_9ACTN|nr:SRPBCC family protein [Streptomyces ficellus]QGV80909.1 SRPBCC family protein [Streptomyces ficellus]
MDHTPQVSVVTVERHIAAPRDRVWEVLTDLHGMPATLSGVTHVEVLTEGPFQAGSRWIETRRMFGKEATEEMWVTACQAPSHYVVEAESRGTHYVSEFTVRETGPGETLVRMAFSARPPGGLGGLFVRLLGGLGRRAVAKAVERDLADVAVAAERRPA